MQLWWVQLVWELVEEERERWWQRLGLVLVGVVQEQRTNRPTWKRLGRELELGRWLALVQVLVQRTNRPTWKRLGRELGLER
jgi:hypothetical protein